MTRNSALTGVALSIALLIPGIVAPVITVRGYLDPKGVATLAPKLLDQGLTDSSVAAFRPLLNPSLLPLVDAAPGGLKGALVTQIGTQLGKSLAAGQPIEVYTQTRSILGSVQHLYSVGSITAATLILLFSVIVPFTKSALVLWAISHRDAERRGRTMRFVETIGQWSMADGFAVALFIAYLAAKASQSPAGSGPSSVTFNATFGLGFYLFAAYCIVSMATQQLTGRWVRAADRPGSPPAAEG